MPRTEPAEPVRSPRSARGRRSPHSIDSIVEAIVYLYTESRRVTKGLAREVGLTGPQLTVIKLLEQLGDLSLSSLSERIRARNSTVTGIIDRMEQGGLVVRERSTADRRVVLIRLTDKGAELAKRVRIEPMEIFRTALTVLDDRDFEDLVRILHKLERRVVELVAAEASDPLTHNQE
jgi:DNA-binding MarR family transcriptional regulator